MNDENAVQNWKESHYTSYAWRGRLRASCFEMRRGTAEFGQYVRFYFNGLFHMGYYEGEIPNPIMETERFKNFDTAIKTISEKFDIKVIREYEICTGEYYRP